MEFKSETKMIHEVGISEVSEIQKVPTTFKKFAVGRYLLKN